MYVHIYVKQQHIEAGLPLDPCECPVALAIKECPRIKAKQYVAVGPYEIHFKREVWSHAGENPAEVTTPPEVADFIGEFDSWATVRVGPGPKPLSFILDVPGFAVREAA